MPGSAATKNSYYPALDGLRFLCCTAVIVAHTFIAHPWFPYAIGLARMGVDIFFSLSGFLITTLLLREKGEREGSADLFKFYVRRTLRIWPVYFAAIFATIILAKFFGARFLSIFGDHDLSLHAGTVLLVYGLFLGNWIYLTVPTTLDILWSISIEEQFYILFPVTFVFSRKRFPALLPVLIGLAVTTTARGIAARHYPTDTIYVNTFTHGDNLLFGALLAQLAFAFPAVVNAVVRRGGALLEAATFIAIPVYYCFLSSHRLGTTTLTLTYTVSAILSTLLVAVLGFGEGRIGSVLSHKRLIYLGNLTYAGYVFHQYAVAVAWGIFRRIIPNQFYAGLIRWTLAVPLTFLLAYVVRITFEARILDLKKRFAPSSEKDQPRRTMTVAQG